ncbi:MAG: hypothetical protein SW833_13390 [Cyanobacteriota bacterium]|nr:hypothetical protein [Cyanobacteriota bacterium]
MLYERGLNRVDSAISQGVLWRNPVGYENGYHHSRDSGAVDTIKSVRGLTP